jgi:ferredoxin
MDSLNFIQATGPLNKSIFIVSDEQKIDAFCLKCPEKQCINSYNGLGLPVELCPAGAISVSEKLSGIKISDSCFGCGICTMVCPVEAIHISPSGKAIVGENSTGRLVRNVISTEWESWISGKLKRSKLSRNDLVEVARFLSEKCLALRGNYFYKIIESLLLQIGYEATMSNLGDTNNRIDLIIRTLNGSVPVEIKSYTETPTINLKSLQQALENKLLISRLDGETSLNTLSTLVVGYSYPSDRAGLEEHILQIKSAYGINIGIITLERLWETLLNQRYSDNKIESKDLTNLIGIL